MTLPKLFRVEVTQEYIAEDTVYVLAHTEEEAESLGEAAAELDPEPDGMVWASSQDLGSDPDEMVNSLKRWDSVVVSGPLLGKDIWQWCSIDNLANFFDPEFLEKERIRRIEADNGQLPLPDLS